jgi:hypothetical protein
MVQTRWVNASVRVKKGRETSVRIRLYVRESLLGDNRHGKFLAKTPSDRQHGPLRLLKESAKAKLLWAFQPQTKHHLAYRQVGVHFEQTKHAHLTIRAFPCN